MMESLIPLALVVTVLMVVLMIAVWGLALKLDNFGIVDAAWSLSFALVAFLAATTGAGWSPRRIAMATAVSLWSLRLGIYLWRRIASHHPIEDRRYSELRKEYGAHVKARMFAFFQMQGASVVLLTIPFMLIAQNPAEGFSVIEIAGFVVWGLSLFGESLSDRQLNRFKSAPENRGKVCDVGLWRYSRHPNYFFESCVWLGYFMMALGSPGGVYTIYCPLAILFLVVKVTGIPPAEKASLQSRGDAYRSYQARTSAFIPWFPKGGGK